jgi:Fis family transcriptional regulator, factor for inversion stimulation protein
LVPNYIGLIDGLDLSGNTHMASKKKTRTRKPTRDITLKSGKINGRSHNGHGNGHMAVPLRTQTAAALDEYFTNLNGDRPGHLYELVLREVEEPLFRAVLDYVAGNQSRAAEVLGMNRGTLRKKLRSYQLTD